MHRQLRAHVHQQGQRIVGLLLIGHRAEAQALRCATFQRFGNRIGHCFFYVHMFAGTNGIGSDLIMFA